MCGRKVVSLDCETVSAECYITGFEMSSRFILKADIKHTAFSFHHKGRHQTPYWII